MKNRGERRQQTERVIKHRQNICKNAYGWDWWPDEQANRYSKGKIHCSCPLCRSKTTSNSFGDRSPRNMSKIEEMNDKERDYEDEEL